MIRPIINGLVGACALTAAHQVLRRVVPDAPRMDLAGMRGMDKAFDAMGIETPRREKLYKYALLGDIVANTLMYSQVGGRGGLFTWMRGLIVGASSGVAAATLTPALGLGKDTSQRTPRQFAMTIGIYTLGGLAAALAAQILSNKK